MPRPCEYESAREFFAAVRDAAREADRTRAQIERMEASEGVRAQGYEPRVSGSKSDPHGMGRTDARIDFESRMRRRLEEDYRMLDWASEVIYGAAHDGRGGIDALLGSSVADCLWWRFCDGASWGEVARATNLSVAECRRKVAYAVNACDFLGWADVVAGIGAAEDRKS